MKARVKETGEIVEIVGEGIQNSNMVMADHGEWFTKDELDIVPLSWKLFEPTYWQKLEHQYAGMAMQGIMNNPIGFENIRARGTNIQIETALLASEFAHALVEKMKEVK